MRLKFTSGQLIELRHNEDGTQEIVLDVPREQVLLLCAAIMTEQRAKLAQKSAKEQGETPKEVISNTPVAPIMMDDCAHLEDGCADIEFARRHPALDWQAGILQTGRVPRNDR